MNLQFTLEEMDALYQEATAYTQQFEAAIENLDNAVNELSGYWTSEETGTYQSFQNLYKTKKQTLIAARDYMKKFCAKVSEKRSDFTAAANKVKNTFE